jgi:hypothetical protein
MPNMPTNKNQVTRKGQMNKKDLSQATPTSRPRDDLRTAYGGDENHGPASNPKSKNAKGGKVKGKRLASSSGKIPVR